MLMLLLGCVKQVAWDIQPIAPVAVGGGPLTVAVVAGERSCIPMARQLEEAFRARPGVSVVSVAEARVRLTVAECAELVIPRVTIDSQDVGISAVDTAHFERRRYELEGHASASMLVEADGIHTVLDGNTDRQLSSGWISADDFVLPSMMEFEEALRRDVAWDLADQLAPLPETIRRTIYRDPEPGTAQMLHNQAVAAEQSGNLDEALRLAREAYAANPSARSLAYLEALEAHAQAVGYAFRLE
jgi:hypothetical protein